MSDFKFTRYFEEEVLKKRAYLKKEWCVRVVEDPLKVEPQERNLSDFGAWFQSWKGVFCE